MVGSDAEPASPAEDLVVPSARPKVRARPAKSAEDRGMGGEGVGELVLLTPDLQRFGEFSRMQ